MQRMNIAVPVLIAVALCVAPHAYAGGCDAVWAASLKTMQTPHHTFITTTHSAAQMQNSDTVKRIAGKPLYPAKVESVESIFDGKVEYLQHHGQWMRSPISHQDILDLMKDNSKAPTTTCTAAGAQSINGKAVTLYHVRHADSGVSEVVRILNSTGLVDGGTTTTADGAVIESRTEYTNVHAPAGVR